MFVECDASRQKLEEASCRMLAYFSPGIQISALVLCDVHSSMCQFVFLFVSRACVCYFAVVVAEGWVEEGCANIEVDE